MKYYYSLIFVFFFTLNSFAQSPLQKQNNALNSALKNLQNDPDLKNASITFLAIDTKTKEVIAELNPDLSILPASTLKVISTSTFLELYGPDYRFLTTIEYSGTIDKDTKTLNGNIYIKGSGDPTLASSYFYKYTQDAVFINWANAIKNAGIDSIDGQIIADASFFSDEMVPRGWAWEDLGNYYGAGPSGLTIFDNMYTIHLKSGATEGDPTLLSYTEPYIPGLILKNMLTAANSSADNAYVFGAPYSYDRYMMGNIPKNRSDFTIKGSIPDPPFFVAYTLHNYLLKEGVRINNSPTTVRIQKQNGSYKNEACKEIIRTNSPTLTEIINLTNEKSINLFAEHCLASCGVSLVGTSETLFAAEAVTEYWKQKGMDTDGMFLSDGSGLSRDNTITARQMVFVLSYMKNNSKYADTFFNSLPISGESGTLKSFGKQTAIHGKVNAKSGSIRLVRAYAGYTSTASGRDVAFYANISNYNCSSSAARIKIQNLLIALAGLNI